MGSYEQRSANTWRIRERIRLNGRTRSVEETLHFDLGMPQAEQLRRVLDALADLEADVKNGTVDLPPEDITFAQFAQRYLEDYARPATSVGNVKTLTNMLDKRILPALGQCSLRSLNAHQLQRFINGLSQAPKTTTILPPDQRSVHTKDPDKLRRQMQAYQQHLASAKPLSPTYVHQYYTYLSSMLSRAVKWEYLKQNPMDNVVSPKVRKRKPTFLDDDQAVALLRQLAAEENMMFRAAVLLALLCGLRLGEVGALTWEDVRFDDGSINITRALKYAPELGSYIGSTKSESSVRTVDLPDGMLRLLEETRAYQDYCAGVLGDRWRGIGRIVCNWDGSPMHHGTPSKQWRKFADKHGFVGIRFHDLRHSHASILLSSNVDVVSVSSRLGHENAGTTLKVYAHAVRKRDRTSADIMDTIMTRANETP